jgi:DNA-binding protein HU-beta
MNQAETIRTVAEVAEVPQAQVKHILETLGEVIKANLTNDGDEVALPGAGKLKTSLRASRTGRNPQTGEEVQIPAALTVKFSATKALKDAINA